MEVYSSATVAMISSGVGMEINIMKHSVLRYGGSSAI